MATLRLISSSLPSEEDALDAYSTTVAGVAERVARAGLRPEDLIVAIDGTVVEGAGDLQRLMAGELIGSTVGATVIRQGRELELELVPAELEA